MNMSPKEPVVSVIKHHVQILALPLTCSIGPSRPASYPLPMRLTCTDFISVPRCPPDSPYGLAGRELWQEIRRSGVPFPGSFPERSPETAVSSSDQHHSSEVDTFYVALSFRGFVTVLYHFPGVVAMGSGLQVPALSCLVSIISLS